MKHLRDIFLIICCRIPIPVCIICAFLLAKEHNKAWWVFCILAYSLRSNLDLDGNSKKKAEPTKEEVKTWATKRTRLLKKPYVYY